MNDTKELTEIQEAHLLRAFELIADSWENDDALTIEEMTIQLEQTIEVINDRIDFDEFLNITKLKNVTH